MFALRALVAGFAAVGLLQALAGVFVVWRFVRRPRSAPLHYPATTVLKPLHGTEPLLEQALATVCAQDYPAFQVVCGVQDPADPALAVVRRLQARFPAADLTVVVDPTQHGPNRKVGNLINMLPAAKHGVLVIADSDVHAAPDYLARIAAALEQPGTALVTTLYTGLPAQGAAAARLGATQITHSFLPGALLGRTMGRQDCLGATMALRRETLDAVGGLSALVQHLADDHELGRLARGRGAVVLADTVPATTVPETTLAQLYAHELRWARTIGALVPGQFAASALQYPLFWAGLALVFTGFAPWTLALFAAAWAVRAGAAMAIDRLLGLAIAAPVWLLPVRDAMSMIVLIASYRSDRVVWRGHQLHATSPSAAPGE
jgi:ceramide glucosyltransferase